MTLDMVTKATRLLKSNLGSDTSKALTKYLSWATREHPEAPTEGVYQQWSNALKSYGGPATEVETTAMAMLESSKTLREAYDRAWGRAQRGGYAMTNWEVYKICQYVYRNIDDLMWGDQLLELEIPPPVMVIDRLLTAGLSMVVGRPKSGKSWWAYNECLALSAGIPALNCGSFTCEPAKSIYGALESYPARARQRLMSMTESRQDLREYADNIGIKFTLPPLTAEFGARCADVIASYLDTYDDLRLFVIDTFAQVKRSGNKSQDVYIQDTESLRELQQLALSYDVAIQIIHHFNKGKWEHPLDMINGSNGIAGSLDQAFVIIREADSREVDVFTVSRDTDLEGYYAATFDDSGQWTMTLERPKPKVTERQQEIIDCLRIEGASQPKHLAQCLETSAASIRNVLRRLIKIGHVHKSSRGTYELTCGNTP